MSNERKSSTVFAALVAAAAAAAACTLVVSTSAGAPALPAGAASTDLALLPPLPLVGLAALVLVQFVFARKHFGDHVGALAAMLTACSPLALGAARLGTPDVLAAAAQVATLWLFYSVVREPGNRVALALCALAFVLALALKERSAALAVPMLGFALCERFANRRAVPFGRVALALAVPLFAGCALWALADGSFAAAALGPRNAYTAQLGRGAWHRHVVDLLLLSPWTTVLAIGAVALAVWRRRHAEDEPVACYLALVAVLAIAGWSSGSKSVRDVLAIDALLRVLVVGYVAKGATFPARTARKRDALALAIVVLLLCTAEVASFRKLFLRSRIADPTSAALLEARKLVPSTQG